MGRLSLTFNIVKNYNKSMISKDYRTQIDSIRSKLNKVSHACRGLRNDLATIKTETERARLKA